MKRKSKLQTQTLSLGFWLPLLYLFPGNGKLDLQILGLPYSVRATHSPSKGNKNLQVFQKPASAQVACRATSCTPRVDLSRNNLTQEKL